MKRIQGLHIGITKKAAVNAMREYAAQERNKVIDDCIEAVNDHNRVFYLSGIDSVLRERLESLKV